MSSSSQAGQQCWVQHSSIIGLRKRDGEERRSTSSVSGSPFETGSLEVGPRGYMLSSQPRAVSWDMGPSPGHGALPWDNFVILARQEGGFLPLSNSTATFSCAPFTQSACVGPTASCTFKMWACCSCCCSTVSQVQGLNPLLGRTLRSGCGGRSLLLLCFRSLGPATVPLRYPKELWG